MKPQRFLPSRVSPRLGNRCGECKVFSSKIDLRIMNASSTMNSLIDNGFSMVLSRNGSLVLHGIEDLEDSFQVSAPGSQLNPKLDAKSLLRLAVEVIRHPATAKLAPYTAVKQLRMRYSRAAKALLRERIKRIETHFGGSLPLEKRLKLAKDQELPIDSGLKLQQLEEDCWQLVCGESASRPIVSWQQLVTLAVIVLRDYWTECHYPDYYLPMLRTPAEQLERQMIDPRECSVEAELPQLEQTAATEEQALGDSQVEQNKILDAERKEIELMFEKLISDESALANREAELEAKRGRLMAKESQLRSLEELIKSGLDSAQALTASAVQQPEQVSLSKAQRKRRRRRRNRGN